MLKSPGRSRIDAVDIGKLEVDFFTQKVEGMDGAVMSAKYALVISEEGIRLGAGTRNVWSENTLAKLRELLKAMEGEICLDVFGADPTTDGAVAAVEDTSDGVPGL